MTDAAAAIANATKYPNLEDTPESESSSCKVGASVVSSSSGVGSSESVPSVIGYADGVDDVAVGTPIEVGVEATICGTAINSSKDDNMISEERTSAFRLYAS
jgi:hypothetical protein